MIKFRHMILALGALAVLPGCVIKPATPEGVQIKCAELVAAGRNLPTWCPAPSPPPPPPPPPPGGMDRPPPTSERVQ
ncbi:MAG: hypothetical protein MUF14_07290 [Hyphomonadaceae bacterium]|jgi:hypothetical protein|nr:hypothetical protein [Hyphomonadaceae bacterium]